MGNIGSDNGRWPRESKRSIFTSRRSTWRIPRIEVETLTKEEAVKRRIDLLPALACMVLFGEDSPHPGTFNDPALRVLLMGTRDEGSSLFALRNFGSTIIQKIYSYIVPEWSNRVTLTIPAHCVGKITGDESCLIRFNEGRPTTFGCSGDYIFMNEKVPQDRGIVSFSKCGKVDFPEPKDINVNMMPFIIGSIDSLPDKLKCYYPLIEQCPYDDEEIGKVGYLTVHESYVNCDEAQRRRGIHIETPGSILEKSKDGDDGACRFSPTSEHHWGMGLFVGHDRFYGGIYMASNVSGTSQVYDALVHNSPGIVDRHGGCEHLRSYIGPGTVLKANELIWMTDRTPHEALPQKSSGYRQFFRLVTSNVSHWFADHCTPNPVVPIPDQVTVVHGNKFVS